MVEPTHLKNMSQNGNLHESSPNKGENEKYLKSPPPRFLVHRGPLFDSMLLFGRKVIHSGEETIDPKSTEPSKIASRAFFFTCNLQIYSVMLRFSSSIFPRSTDKHRSNRPLRVAKKSGEFPPQQFWNFASLNSSRVM